MIGATLMAAIPPFTWILTSTSGAAGQGLAQNRGTVEDPRTDPMIWSRLERWHGPAAG